MYQSASPTMVDASTMTDEVPEAGASITMNDIEFLQDCLNNVVAIKDHTILVDCVAIANKRGLRNPRSVTSRIRKVRDNCGIKLGARNIAGVRPMRRLRAASYESPQPDEAVGRNEPAPIETSTIDELKARRDNLQQEIDVREEMLREEEEIQREEERLKAEQDEVKKKRDGLRASAEKRLKLKRKAESHDDKEDVKREKK